MTIKKQVSLHGRRAYVSPDDDLVSRGAVATGGEDKASIILPGAHSTVALFDDFLGDTGNLNWTHAKGDTGYPAAVITTGTGGIVRMTGSETQAVAPTAAQALTQGLMKQWKVDSGGPKGGRLRMSARLKLGTVSRTAEGGRTHVFVGFSDSGGAEMPAYDTGAGVISNAADLCGFLLSPGGDTGWSCVSAKSTASDSGDQLAVAGSSYAPTSNVYTALEMEIRNGVSDTGATAHFWIDGTNVGSISSPVNSATAMTPWIGMWTQDTGFANTLDIDYIACSAPRDTGL
jgi:hypothetical protein